MKCTKSKSIPNRNYLVLLRIFSIPFKLTQCLRGPCLLAGCINYIFEVCMYIQQFPGTPRGGHGLAFVAFLLPRQPPKRRSLVLKQSLQDRLFQFQNRAASTLWKKREQKIEVRFRYYTWSHEATPSKTNAGDGIRYSEMTHLSFNRKSLSFPSANVLHKKKPYQCKWNAYKWSSNFDWLRHNWNLRIKAFLLTWQQNPKHCWMKGNKMHLWTQR